MASFRRGESTSLSFGLLFSSILYVNWSLHFLLIVVVAPVSRSRQLKKSFRVVLRITPYQRRARERARVFRDACGFFFNVIIRQPAVPR